MENIEVRDLACAFQLLRTIGARRCCFRGRLTEDALEVEGSDGQRSIVVSLAVEGTDPKALGTFDAVKPRTIKKAFMTTARFGQRYSSGDRGSFEVIQDVNRAGRVFWKYSYGDVCYQLAFQRSAQSIMQPPSEDGVVWRLPTRDIGAALKAVSSAMPSPSDGSGPAYRQSLMYHNKLFFWPGENAGFVWRPAAIDERLPKKMFFQKPILVSLVDVLRQQVVTELSAWDREQGALLRVGNAWVAGPAASLPNWPQREEEFARELLQPADPVGWVRRVDLVNALPPLKIVAPERGRKIVFRRRGERNAILRAEGHPQCKFVEVTFEGQVKDLPDALEFECGALADWVKTTIGPRLNISVRQDGSDVLLIVREGGQLAYCRARLLTDVPEADA